MKLRPFDLRGYIKTREDLDAYIAALREDIPPGPALSASEFNALSAYVFNKNAEVFEALAKS